MAAKQNPAQRQSGLTSLFVDTIQIALTPPHRLWLATLGGYSLAVKAATRSWEALRQEGNELTFPFDLRVLPRLRLRISRSAIPQKPADQDVENLPSALQEKMTELEKKIREQGSLLKDVAEETRDTMVSLATGHTKNLDSKVTELDGRLNSLLSSHRTVAKDLVKLGEKVDQLQKLLTDLRHVGIPSRSDVERLQQKVTELENLTRWLRTAQ